ncbi:MAG: 50S ribosomal protein L9 [Deltaproteobacteria bacterium]|nr:50S ribosomal protein L9 [Deltaproteobacteria bacterium]
MKVILREDVSDLGSMGEFVEVKPGYARNYLLPKKLAVIATTKNIKQLEHERNVIHQRMEKAKLEAEKLAKRIESLSVTVAKQVGEEDRIFGSVTAKEIEESLREEGIRINRRNIQLEEPIRSLGVYQVTIKLYKDIMPSLKVWVVAK